jgi:hypothetical protein
MDTQENAPVAEKSKVNWFMWLSFVLLIVVAILGWRLLTATKQIETITIEKQAVNDEKGQLITKLEGLKKDYEKLSKDNTELSDMFNKEKERVSTLLEKVKKSSGSIEVYKGKVAAMEGRLKEYEQQIEQLKSQNKELIETNFNIKTQLDSATVEYKELSSQNTDLSDKVNKGSVLTSYDINAGGIISKSSGKELPTKKAKRADRLRVCFTIGENPLTTPGPKTVYIRIAEPSGNILSPGTGDEYSFDYQGKKLQYSVKEQINYANKPIDLCSYWKKAKEFTVGTYYIDIFVDGNNIGSSTFIFEK